jgi:hypothetical protein
MSIEFGIDSEHDRAYYIVNRRYAYDASTLELVPEVNPDTQLDIDREYVENYQTHPVHIFTSDGIYIVDQQQLNRVRGRVHQVNPLLVPDRSQIVPGSQSLPAANLPQFNRDLLRRLEELALNESPIEELFTFLVIQRDQEFQQNYSVLIRRLYGLQ